MFKSEEHGKKYAAAEERFRAAMNAGNPWPLIPAHGLTVGPDLLSGMVDELCKDPEFVADIEKAAWRFYAGDYGTFEEWEQPGYSFWAYRTDQETNARSGRKYGYYKTVYGKIGIVDEGGVVIAYFPIER